MADELAELAEYAGCPRLSTLFTLASIEAENSPPVSPWAKNPTAQSKKRSNNRSPPLVLLDTCKAAQVISGMDAVGKIKKGAKEDNGAVAAPGKIVKMQIASETGAQKR